MLSRSFLLVLSQALLILLCVSCKSAQPPREGFLVASSSSPKAGFTPGDTLREAYLDTLPRTVRATWKHLRNDSTGDLACTRAFVADTVVVIYQPAICGRELRGSELLLPSPMVVISVKGAILDSASGGWIIRTICPIERGRDGSPYYGEYWYLDGCWHRWWDTPDSLLTPGTVTQLGVILPDAVQRGMLNQCTRDVPKRADFEWEPSVAVINQLESLLPTFVRAHDSAVADSLSRYIRQYGGFGVGQDSLVYVNLAWPWDSTHTSPNLRSPEIVCDGGKGFFGVVYNPRTRRFSHLAFNGTA